MALPPTPPAALLTAVERELALPVPSQLPLLCAPLRERFGDALAAVLFYGSCLRSGDPGSGVADLYAIVDDYTSAYPGPLLRIANSWLPPNVFVLATPTAGGGVLRAKYAVVSLADFEAGCGSWFQSYLWGRFAQPSRLAYGRDGAVRARVCGAVAQAVVRLLQETLPLMPSQFDSDALWRCALALSYRTELRAESAARPAELADVDAATYRCLTAAAAPALGAVQTDAHGYQWQACAARRRRGRRRWRRRRWQGRILHLARLAKAVFTFENGVDYLAWKLERHTGVAITVTPRLRRHPLVFGWPVLWRLLRERRLR